MWTELLPLLLVRLLVPIPRLVIKTRRIPYATAALPYRYPDTADDDAFAATATQGTSKQRWCSLRGGRMTNSQMAVQTEVQQTLQC